MAATAGRQAIYTTYVYRLPAIAAILFYWIRMKVVQHDLSNIGRPNDPAYPTGELLNTPQVVRV